MSYREIWSHPEYSKFANNEGVLAYDTTQQNFFSKASSIPDMLIKDDIPIPFPRTRHQFVGRPSLNWSNTTSEVEPPATHKGLIYDQYHA